MGPQGRGSKALKPGQDVGTSPHVEVFGVFCLLLLLLLIEVFDSKLILGDSGQWLPGHLTPVELQQLAPGDPSRPQGGKGPAVFLKGQERDTKNDQHPPQAKNMTLCRMMCEHLEASE